MEQENNKRNKIIVAIIGVLVLLVALATATYAWFSARSTTEVNKPITTAKTELIVSIDEEASHISNIKPTTWNTDMAENNKNLDIVQIPITVTNNSTIDVKYFLRLSASGLELKDKDENEQPLEGGELSNVKYKLYETTEGVDVTNPVAEGDFATPEIDQTIVNKKEIGKLNSEDNKPNIHKYILYVYIEEKNKDQNELQEIEFDVIINGDTRAPELFTLSEAILENEKDKIQEKEPTFTTTSTDRGLYEMETEKGTIYYYRGSETAEVDDESYKPEYEMKNYVSFGTHTKDVTNKIWNGSTEVDEKVAKSRAPMIWRIVRINEDGSVKLIAENNIGNSWHVWNSKKVADYVNKDEGKTSSDIKQAVDNWYKETFETAEGYPENKKLATLVKETEFCNDRQGLSSSSSAVFNRLYKDRGNTPPQPTLKCEDSNDIVRAKAGLISADELVL